MLFCISARSQNLQFRVPDSLIVLDEDPFTELYSGRLQTTFLYDKAFPFIDISKYDGVYDTTVSYNSWNQLYLDLFNSNIPESSFMLQSLETFHSEKTQIYNTQDGQITPITILNLYFDQVTEDALTAQTMLLVEGKFYDASLETSPYETHRVFAAIPFAERLNSRNPVFNFDIEHYINNTGEIIQNILVDFGDGNGYVEVNFNESYTIHYNEEGHTRDIFIKLITDTNEELVSHSVIQLPFTSGYTAPNAIWHIRADIPYGTGDYYTTHGFGKAYIKYSNPNDPVLRKPIIIVEGLDFGDFNTADVNSTLPQLGDFGWPQMYNLDPNRWPQMQQMPVLLDQLTAEGFDIILLDFWNGADYIQRNAFVLLKLIQQINSAKSGNSPNIVLGASMGGQVARYALAYMERNNISHCTSEYISFDSPHKGANISLGLQYWIDFFQDNNAKAQESLSGLNKPAPQQMLVYHYNFSANAIRQNWISSLSTIGYPKQTRNVAVLNGSKTQQGTGFNAGDQLIDYNYHIPLLATIRGNAWSIPGNVYGVIFMGKKPWKSPKDHQSPLGALHFDNAPGGIRDVAKQIADPDPYYEGVRVGEIVSLNDNQCFIPSISALDVNTNNLLYDIDGNISPTNPNKTLTPFDAYYAPTANEKHVDVNGSLTSGQMKWVYDEIKNTQVIVQPSLVNSNFNYGRKITGYRTSGTLLNVTIGNLGNLYINGALPLANGGTVTDYPDNNSTFNVFTSGCSANIEVQSGGKIIVGASSPNNIGILSVEKGSTLTLKANSRLVINNNSKIIIKTGATLIYEAGAVIELVGDESVLQIEGQLEIKNNAVFAFTGNGYFSFATNNNVIMGSNSKVSLVGSGITDKVLEVTSGVAYFPYGTGNLHEFEATNCAINTSGVNAYLSVACDLNIDNVNFYGNEGIRTYGQNPANILNSRFYSNIGISAYQDNEDGAPLYINNCDFIGGYLGLDIYDIGFTIENSRFSGVLRSIKVQNIIFDSYITNVDIAFDLGYESFGVESEGVSYAPVILDNVTINNVKYGVKATNSMVNIKCSYINSEFAAIYLGTNGIANFGTQNGGIYGFNTLTRLEYSGEPVFELSAAYAIYLDEGKNVIRKDDASSVYMDGNFIDFKTFNIMAENNKWYPCLTCTNTLPTNSNFTVGNTVDFKPYETGDLTDQCGGMIEMSMIADPGSTDVLDNCDECASIQYKGKAINKYLKELLNSMAQDTSKIHLLDHFNKLDSAFNYQYTGINLNKRKKIEKIKNRIFENYMSSYSSLINKYKGNIATSIAYNKILPNIENRITKSIYYNDSVEIYKHMMSKAHVLLTQDQYNDALVTLNNIYQYIPVNSNEYNLLERQICLITTEYNFSRNLISVSQLDSAIATCAINMNSNLNSRVFIDKKDTIKNNPDEFSVLIKPNPSNAHMNIELFTSKEEMIDFNMIDIMGRVVLTKSIEVNGSYNLLLDSKEYSAGVYTIVIRTSNKSVTRKVIFY